MAQHRIYNFNPGPAALPLEVLEQIREDFLSYADSGMSITEISHRSRWFDGIINDAVGRTKRLLGLGDDYHVLFIQGGASLQFCMLPMNLLGAGDCADYVNTGTWSTKAIAEARMLGKHIDVVASSKDRGFTYIPAQIAFNSGAVFAHITSNNTIKGTQFAEFPDTGGVPLAADMSSDIMSRPFDARKFGMIYAGAQKNIGPAGVCMVILRQDFLERVPESLPSMLKYSTYTAKNSLYNTPPCFAIYSVQLVLKWLEETIGGLARMAAINAEKAQILYGCIDRSGFYRATAEPGSRSLMNVTFRLPDENLEARFVKEALDAGFGGLKGHRSVGGCRASIYNATGVEAVRALTAFMEEFERTHG